MDSRRALPLPRLPRRNLLKAGAAAGPSMSAEPILAPRPLRAQPRRGGFCAPGAAMGLTSIHLLLGGKTDDTVSLVYRRLVRHEVAAPQNFDARRTPIFDIQRMPSKSNTPSTSTASTAGAAGSPT